MNHRAEPFPPAARQDGLLVESLGNEAVVYDAGSQQAHALAPVAATVFTLCDGRTSVPQLARLTSERLGQPVTDEEVWDALVELEDCNLLTVPKGGGISRRQILKGVAGAAISAPLITSLAMPSAALASQSCNTGHACTSDSDCTGVKISAGLCDDNQTAKNDSSSCFNLVQKSQDGGNTVTCHCWQPSSKSGITPGSHTCECEALGKQLTYTTNTCQFI